VFNKHISYLEAYGNFIDQENQLAAINKIREKKEHKKDKFALFIKETSTKLSRIQKYTDPQMRGSNIKIDLSLETLLSQPAQHGPKIVLLLKELVKYYTGDDATMMLTTITNMEETIKRVSNTLKEQRNKEKVEWLKQTITNIGTVNIFGRKFLEENKVKQVIANNAIERVEKIAYLFEDIIIICENNLITSALSFNNLLAMNVPDFPFMEQHGIKHAVQFCSFDVMKGSFHFLFCFESELIKKRWLDIIVKIRTERSQKVKTSLIPRSTSIYGILFDEKKEDNQKSKNHKFFSKKKKSKLGSKMI
jgi:hypothetical protein